MALARAIRAQAMRAQASSGLEPVWSNCMFLCFYNYSRVPSATIQHGPFPSHAPARHDSNHPSERCDLGRVGVLGNTLDAVVTRPAREVYVHRAQIRLEMESCGVLSVRSRALELSKRREQVVAELLPLVALVAATAAPGTFPARDDDPLLLSLVSSDLGCLFSARPERPERDETRDNKSLIVLEMRRSIMQVEYSQTVYSMYHQKSIHAESITWRSDFFTAL